jgi:hypothetical protein
MCWHVHGEKPNVGKRSTEQREQPRQNPCRDRQVKSDGRVQLVDSDGTATVKMEARECGRLRNGEDRLDV